MANSSDFVKRQRTDTPARSARQCHPRIWASIAWQRCICSSLVVQVGDVCFENRARSCIPVRRHQEHRQDQCAHSRDLSALGSISVVLTRTGDSETSKSESSLVSPWQPYNFVLVSTLYKRGPFILTSASHTFAFATSRSRICFVPAGLVARIGKCDLC